MKRSLAGMVVVISGASSGLGRELAIQLSRQGTHLVLAARRLELLDELNAQLGGGHLCVGADVSQPQDCARIIKKTQERFGRIDTLICNAGYGQVELTASTSPEDLRQIFATNVHGTVDLIHAAVPIMKVQSPQNRWRGQIMIVSSAAAGRGLPYFGPYAATKAAQKSLAEALRVELKPERIAVTSVHPIGTQTDFFSRAESLSNLRLQTPQRKAWRQSATKVARKMIKAIEKPRAELWPFYPVKFALMLGFMFPGIADRIMETSRRQIQLLNQS